MSKRLSGKVAIVTGGGRGIGSAIARALGRQGATVVVNYASNDTAARQTVEAIEAEGSRALAAKSRLDGESAVRALFEAALSAFGRVDSSTTRALRVLRQSAQ